MARQPRIQYSGALYRVLARGDRREPMVNDDGDRQAFFRTVEQVCDRAGVLIRACALLEHHSQRVLETPDANLVEAMSWF
jgi:hypothetical protein